MEGQLSFLEDEVPRGYSYIHDFITPAEEVSLLEEIRKLQWQEVKLHGVVARRKVVHFGMDYKFDSRSVNPLGEYPDFISNLLPRVAAALGVKSSELKEVLVSHYPPGAPIGWHRDAPMFEKLLGISLASSCVMKLRKESPQGQRILKYQLAPRSAYTIEGDARWSWQHHIPPVKEERYSVTFRTLLPNYKTRNR